MGESERKEGEDKYFLILKFIKIMSSNELIEEEFKLDPVLKKDSIFIKDLPLCQLRLINDSRFIWFLLVPRVPEVTEIYELSEDDQFELMMEISRLCQMVRETSDKANVGALGNIVRQLHVHVIGRKVGDSAWPGPVWGSGEMIPYTKENREKLSELVQKLKVQAELDELN